MLWYPVFWQYSNHILITFITIIFFIYFFYILYSNIVQFNMLGMEKLQSEHFIKLSIPTGLNYKSLVHWANPSLSTVHTIPNYFYRDCIQREHFLLRYEKKSILMEMIFLKLTPFLFGHLIFLRHGQGSSEISYIPLCDLGRTNV